MGNIKLSTYIHPLKINDKTTETKQKLIVAH